MNNTDVKKSKFIQVGKGRLKPNSNSTNLSPTHTGTLKVDVETLQNLISDNNDGNVYLPIAAWVKNSKFDNRQYIDITTSQFVKNINNKS